MEKCKSWKINLIGRISQACLKILRPWFSPCLRVSVVKSTPKHQEIKVEHTGRH